MQKKSRGGGTVWAQPRASRAHRMESTRQKSTPERLGVESMCGTPSKMACAVVPSSPSSANSVNSKHKHKHKHRQHAHVTSVAKWNGTSSSIMRLSADASRSACIYSLRRSPTASHPLDCSSSQPIEYQKRKFPKF
jgi:hypothetical protein